MQQESLVAYFLLLHEQNWVISCIFFIYFFAVTKSLASLLLSHAHFFLFLLYRVALNIPRFYSILFTFLPHSLTVFTGLSLAVFVPASQAKWINPHSPPSPVLDSSEKIWLGLPVCLPGHCHLLIAFSWREVGGRERAKDRKGEGESEEGAGERRAVI